jgi:cysteine sulfinate desulfinase/cysteine desulfurase-like protein
MGIDTDEAVGSIRISFGRETTDSDVEDLLDALKDVLDQLATFPSAEN